MLPESVEVMTSRSCEHERVVVHDRPDIARRGDEPEIPALARGPAKGVKLCALHSVIRYEAAARDTPQLRYNINSPKASDCDWPGSREREQVVIRPLAGARGYRKDQCSQDGGLSQRDADVASLAVALRFRTCP